MRMSDKIASFIEALIEEEQQNAWLELRRNELAQIFSCAPSQINYVISTRFNPQHGYDVESRRGGGGCIRIRRIPTDNAIYSAASAIGETLSALQAQSLINALISAGAADERTAAILGAATADAAIPITQPQRDYVRAAIMRSTLTALL